MRYLLLLVINVAWALWFGGTIAVFIFVPYLFHSHPEVAREANSAIFIIFCKYELWLAAAAALGASLLLVAYPSKSALGLLAALIVSGGMAITVSLGLLPRMEALRQQGLQQSEEWKTDHGKSMIAMTLQSVVLLMGGAAILGAARPPRQPVIVQTEIKADSEYEPI
jgi:hypothetical protein